MPRPGYVSVTVPEDLAAELDELRPRMGLSAIRPEDGRQRDSRALVVQRLVQHFHACPKNGVLAPLEVYARAEGP